MGLPLAQLVAAALVELALHQQLAAQGQGRARLGVDQIVDEVDQVLEGQLVDEVIGGAGDVRRAAQAQGQLVQRAPPGGVGIVELGLGRHLGVELGQEGHGPQLGAVAGARAANHIAEVGHHPGADRRCPRGVGQEGVGPARGRLAGGGPEQLADEQAHRGGAEVARQAAQGSILVG